MNATKTSKTTKILSLRNEQIAVADRMRAILAVGEKGGRVDPEQLRDHIDELEYINRQLAELGVFPG